MAVSGRGTAGHREDIIGSAGYRIGPNEIEEVLLQHPSVAEVAVIGGPTHSGARS
jgi:acyl-coenzyme A synthetase/AMP-(fatty) acid ligase